MGMFKLALNACAGLFLAGAIAIGSSSGASALSAQFTVQDQYGATITLDTSSCTSGSISPPFSISSGGSSTFSGTTTGTTTLCTVRYQNGSNGCQFQVQVFQSGTTITGFASTNAYKGSGGRPSCIKVFEGVITGGTQGYQGIFKMQ
jgi:hypothetical protein